MCNWLNIDGRCDCTTTFLMEVSNYCYSKRQGNSTDESKPKSEENYLSYLLLNHPELDGFIEKGNGDCWDIKYFYMPLDRFKNAFDFEEAQRVHDKTIMNLKKEIKDYKNEIDNIRTHQEKVETKIAFECFEEKINELKDNITNTKEYLEDVIEDDYEYNHSSRIKLFFEIIEDLISKDPNLIVTAYADD